MLFSPFGERALVRTHESSCFSLSFRGAVIVYASLGVFVLLLITYGSVYTFGPIFTVASLREFDFIPVFASILS